MISKGLGTTISEDWIPKLNEVYLQAQTELEAQSTTIRKPMVSAFQNIQNYYQTHFHEKDIFDRRSTVEVDVIVVPIASDLC